MLNPSPEAIKIDACGMPLAALISPERLKPGASATGFSRWPANGKTWLDERRSAFNRKEPLAGEK